MATPAALCYPDQATDGQARGTVWQRFQQKVREEMRPRTVALFRVIERATPDKAVAALHRYGGM